MEWPTIDRGEATGRDSGGWGPECAGETPDKTPGSATMRPSSGGKRPVYRATVPLRPGTGAGKPSPASPAHLQPSSHRLSTQPSHARSKTRTRQRAPPRPSSRRRMQWAAALRCKTSVLFIPPSCIISRLPLFNPCLSFLAGCSQSHCLSSLNTFLL